MDLLQRLRKVEPDGEGERTRWYRNPDGLEAANEIERLRGALKTFVDSVKKTNVGIDENWAKTVYPLKAEIERLRQQNAELLEAAKVTENKLEIREGQFRGALGELIRTRQQNVELVEVLKEIANADMFDDECKPTGGGYLINKARAAIAKATGGE